MNVAHRFRFLFRNQAPSPLGPRAPSPALSAKRELVLRKNIYDNQNAGEGARAPSINVRQLTGLNLKSNHLGPHRLSQSIDANQVSAGFGVTPNVFKIDVSGYFDRD